MRAERVLVVTDEMEVGGSQRQIVHLLRGLQATGRRPELLYFRKSSHLVEALRTDGIPVHRIEKRGAIDPAFAWRLWRHLRAGAYDVVHAFSITAEMWVRLALLGVPRTRLVSSIRGLGLQGPDWHWRAKRWIVGGSSAVISNSVAGAKLVARRCELPMARIDVVPNGLELPPPRDGARRAAARRDAGLDLEQPLLLFVGRLVPEKNLPLLLDALAAMGIAAPMLWVAGDGPERTSLEQRAQRLGIAARVRWLGERRDTQDLMAAADALVLPSREEGLSNVILEAMGAGLPVVATAVGGSPELVDDGETGILVPPGDLDALRRVLALVFDDPALRARLGRAGRERAERRFALTAMVDATARVYDRVLRPEGAVA